MDGWREMTDMTYDASSGKWFMYLSVQSGKKYVYKFLVNGGRWTINEEVESKLEDSGNRMNICQ